MKFKKICDFIVSEKFHLIFVFFFKVTVLELFIFTFLSFIQITDPLVISSSAEFHSGAVFGGQLILGFIIFFYGVIRIPILAFRLLRSFDKGIEDKSGE